MKLKDWRTARKMTQVEVSALTGIDNTRLSRLETGKARAAASEILSIERASDGQVALRDWVDEPAEAAQ